MFGLTPIAAAPFASLAGASYSVNVDELFTLVDLTDVPNMGYAVTLAETFSLSESLASGFTFYTAIDETASVTDNTTGSLGTFAQISEILSLADITASQVNFVGYTAETFVLSESIFPRGWFKIDDSQTNNWTGITTNTTTWSNINTTQTPGWTPIDDSQG